jgi:hypothetical protein
MKNFRAADKTHAGGDEKHDINFHWPYMGLRQWHAASHPTVRCTSVLTSHCAVPILAGVYLRNSTQDGEIMPRIYVCLPLRRHSLFTN